MFGIIIYDILFFAIPAIIIALLGVSIYRYLSAKRKNKLISRLRLRGGRSWFCTCGYVLGVYYIRSRNLFDKRLNGSYRVRLLQADE